MTLSRSAVRAALVVLASVLVTACTGSTVAGPPPHTSPSTTRATSPSAPHTTAVRPPVSTKTAPPGAQWLTMGDAVPAVPGRDYRPITIVPPHLPDGRDIAVVGVDPDGILVAAVAQTFRTETIPPTSVALYRAGDGIIRYLSHGNGPPGARRQVTGAVATRRWVVWTESTSTNLETDPWTVFSFDRRHGVLRQIASAPRTRSGVVPAVPGYTRASLGADGRVYLTAVEQGATGPYRAYVESVPVDGSGPLRREAPDGIAAMASGTDLVWEGGPGDHVVIHHRDLATGRDTVLFDDTGTDCHSFYGLGVAGGVVAWLLQCKGADLVQVWSDGRALATIRDPGHNLGYLRVTSGYVGVAPSRYSGGYRQFFYNVTGRELFTIGKSGSVSGDMPGNGPYLTWASYAAPRASGTAHLVRLLP